MASSKITVESTIVIAASPEEVWDYTQDWDRRVEWDRSVVHAEITSDDPRVVHVRARGGGTFDVAYKLSERPTKTSLAMSRFSSFWLRGGGGAWRYELHANGTSWTQRNTLVLRDGWLGAMAAPLFRWILRRTTEAMMARARKILESQSNVD